MKKSEIKIKKAVIILRLLRSLDFSCQEDYIDDGVMYLLVTDDKLGLTVSMHIDLEDIDEQDIMDRLSKAVNGTMQFYATNKTNKK